jgi:hypothetical protein
MKWITVNEFVIQAFSGEELSPEFFITHRASDPAIRLAAISCNFLGDCDEIEE